MQLFKMPRFTHHDLLFSPRRLFIFGTEKDSITKIHGRKQRRGSCRGRICRGNRGLGGRGAGIELGGGRVEGTWGAAGLGYEFGGEGTGGLGTEPAGVGTELV